MKPLSTYLLRPGWKPSLARALADVGAWAAALIVWLGVFLVLWVTLNFGLGGFLILGEPSYPPVQELDYMRSLAGGIAWPGTTFRMVEQPGDIVRLERHDRISTSQHTWILAVTTNCLTLVSITRKVLSTVESQPHDAEVSSPRPAPREVLDSPELQAAFEDAQRRIREGRSRPGRNADELRELFDAYRSVED